jgi:hypothetical protein
MSTPHVAEDLELLQEPGLRARLALGGIARPAQVAVQAFEQLVGGSPSMVDVRS